jgi:hypothetical protein
VGAYNANVNRYMCVDSCMITGYMNYCVCFSEVWPSIGAGAVGASC